MEKIEKRKVEELKPNPENPRVIKDAKFKKLVKSIKEFPQMLDIRPIVIDENDVVLGGNMRLKALKECGIKEVATIKVEELTEEQKKEFIAKDNVGYGEWDWELLLEQYNVDVLENWGIDIDESKTKKEKEVEGEIKFSEYLDEENNYVLLIFRNEIDWLNAKTHFKLESVYSKRSNGKKWNKGVGRVIDGAKYLTEITSKNL